jgi:hypothetical protein
LDDFKLGAILIKLSSRNFWLLFYIKKGSSRFDKIWDGLHFGRFLETIVQFLIETAETDSKSVCKCNQKKKLQGDPNLTINLQKSNTRCHYCPSEQMNCGSPIAN